MSKPSQASMDKAWTLMGDAIRAWKLERKPGTSRGLNDFTVEHFATALDEVQWERDEYKKLAESWMADYQAMKEKHEPLVAVTSEAAKTKTRR